MNCFPLAVSLLLLLAITRAQANSTEGTTALTQAAGRVAGRLLQENTAERTYRADLALEALLELGTELKHPGWRDHVFAVLARRGLQPSASVPYRTQPFGCLSFAVYRATGDATWVPEFLRESERCRVEHPRSPEGAIMHPRGAQRGGGNAILIDAMQEYAARMARAGAITGDLAWFRECVAQFRIYRTLLRDPRTG